MRPTTTVGGTTMASPPRAASIAVTVGAVTQTKRILAI